METDRVVASGTIGLTGVVLAVISADHLLGDAGGPVGVAVAV